MPDAEDALQEVKVEISAVVTRADGTVENLGIIASTESKE